MSKLDFLLQRRSVPSRLLSAPGPDEASLTALVEAALQVPDHGRLAPFRLLRIEGDARSQLGEFLAALTAARQPTADPAAIEKDRNRFRAAPLILAVIACLTPGHKVPEQEQLLSAGMVGYNLLLGAQALGFGAQWLTGWAAYDAEVARYLGLEPNERVIAFVHIGTATGAGPARTTPAVADKLQTWTAAG
jgi:nitroreductase